MILRPSRWHSERFLVGALLCFGLAMAVMSCFTKDLILATESLSVGRCAETTWLDWLNWCHGIILLELAGDPKSAEQVVSLFRTWDIEPIARATVQLDYLFILSYVALLGFFSATVARVTGVGRVWRAILLVVIVLQGAAGVLDGIENVGLYEMLMFPQIPPHVAERTALVATIKWWLVLAGVVVPLLALLWALAQYTRHVVVPEPKVT